MAAPLPTTYTLRPGLPPPAAYNALRALGSLTPVSPAQAAAAVRPDGHGTWAAVMLVWTPPPGAAALPDVLRLAPSAPEWLVGMGRGESCAPLTCWMVTRRLTRARCSARRRGVVLPPRGRGGASRAPAARAGRCGAQAFAAVYSGGSARRGARGVCDAIGGSAGGAAVRAEWISGLEERAGRGEGDGVSDGVNGNGGGMLGGTGAAMGGKRRGGGCGRKVLHLLLLGGVTAMRRGAFGNAVLSPSRGRVRKSELPAMCHAEKMPYAQFQSCSR